MMVEACRCTLTLVLAISLGLVLPFPSVSIDGLGTWCAYALLPMVYFVGVGGSVSGCVLRCVTRLRARRCVVTEAAFTLFLLGNPLACWGTLLHCICWLLLRVGVGRWVSGFVLRCLVLRARSC